MQQKNGRVLIVDDDEYIGLSLKLLLDQTFEKVSALQDPNDMLPMLEDSYDVVILDMNFRQGETSGEEGMSWLKKINQQFPEVSVVLLTAYGDVGTAVNAMKIGAVDFIVKPWQNEKLLATVRSASRLYQEKKRVTRLQTQQKIISSSLEMHFGEMIGKSEAMKGVFELLRKVAPTPADVLILGENGTGKEVAARTIHRNSARKEEVFIPVDLGAIHENLFESELFGHKKGAFTDAREDRIGRFEAASGGTIFLDEIGNLPLNLQTKLLTVLERREITRVGTNQPIPIDIRVICATNGKLKEMVKQGKFREDLLYRINTVEFTMPPLRDRMEDIPLLVDQMLENYKRKYQRPSLGITDEVISILRSYHWPGNIRELQHAVERAVIMSEGESFRKDDFSFITNKQDDQPGIKDYNLENLEEWAIKKAIRKHQGNISHAARELGLSRGAMYRRMEKYNLS
jgi:DNA-binding NtrC family response regulator